LNFVSAFAHEFSIRRRVTYLDAAIHMDEGSQDTTVRAIVVEYFDRA